MNRLEDLRDRIESREAVIGVVGLGYVGLPLAVEFAKAGPGFVRVEFMENGAKREIRSLGLGVAAERADAREVMGRVLEVLQDSGGEAEASGES